MDDTCSVITYFFTNLLTEYCVIQYENYPFSPTFKVQTSKSTPSKFNTKSEVLVKDLVVKSFWSFIFPFVSVFFLLLH